jgi:hypothetical protein
MLVELRDREPVRQIQEPTVEGSNRPHKTSFWSRKSGANKTPQQKTLTTPVDRSTTVHVLSEQVNFRTVTEFGLYETIRSRGILVHVVIR